MVLFIGKQEREKERKRKRKGKKTEREREREKEKEIFIHFCFRQNDRDLAARNILLRKIGTNDFQCVLTDMGI